MSSIIHFLFSNPLLLALTLIFSFLCVFLLVYSFMPDEKMAAAKKMLGVIDDQVRDNKIFLLRLLRPAFQALAPYFYAPKAAWLVRYQQQRKKNLIAADLLRELSVEEFIGFKCLMTLIIPIMAHYIATIINHPMPWWAYIILALMGAFAPDLWLWELMRSRQRQIFRALPYTMDMLTLSVEAGLDFIAAIKRLSQQRQQISPLQQELQIMLNEISLGTSRAEALRNLSDRVQMREISSFVTLLIQADQLGASIGPVLRAQADSLRTSRFQLAEMKGARAALMILFPLILFILPTTVLILLAPLFVRLMTQGFTGLF